MATKLEIERLVKVETELKMVKEQNEKDHAEIKRDVCEVKESISSMDQKLDAALNGKADRSEVARIEKWLFGLGAILIGFLVWVLQEFLKGLK